MPLRSFHRSQSAIQQPLPSERAYRRAEKFLRDFHRSRSLDIILEEYDGQQHQHHGMLGNNDAGAGSSGCGLKKKRAVLCLADLVQQQQQQQQQHQDGEEMPDRNENTADSEQQPHPEEEEEEEDEGMNTPYWGHFAIDSPSEQATSSSSSPSSASRRHTIPLPSHTKTRTIRRFGRS